MTVAEAGRAAAFAMTSVPRVVAPQMNETTTHLIMLIISLASLPGTATRIPAPIPSRRSIEMMPLAGRSAAGMIALSGRLRSSSSGTFITHSSANAEGASSPDRPLGDSFGLRRALRRAMPGLPPLLADGSELARSDLAPL